MTLIWGLVATIWLPYVDARRTYRWRPNRSASTAPERCIASRNVGEAQRALFYYFAGVVTVPRKHAQARLPGAARAVRPAAGREPGVDRLDVQWRAPPRRRHRALRAVSTRRPHEILRRSDGSRSSPATAATARVVPAREVRPARRARRRRRRARRQHLRGGRPQHQHADRLSLRAHLSRASAARTAAAPTSTARAAKTSCCACRSAP